jgi:integrase
MHPRIAATSIDFAAIRRREASILKADSAPNTRIAYANGWKAFRAWCVLAGIAPLPATTQNVQDFATWCINESYRLSTVMLRLSAITHYHRADGHATPFAKVVRSYLTQARRELKESPRGKTALTYARLCEVVAGLPDTPLGIRNRALILLGFATGWRRSELVALNMADAGFEEYGLHLVQRRSKTDQLGFGREVGIPPGTRDLTCPLRAMRAWLAIRGNWEWPLFVRCRGKCVSRKGLGQRGEVLHLALKGAVAKLGENPRKFGAHSLRAGMITASAENGASESAIMLRTGHRCYEMIRRYIRPTRIFKCDPLKGVL